MAFPGLPETSKMWMFASIVHHLRTNNVDVYVSKIYPSELILRGGGGVYTGGLIFVMLIGLDIWGRLFVGRMGDLYTGGESNSKGRKVIL